jgi:hypothetical protein
LITIVTASFHSSLAAIELNTLQIAWSSRADGLWDSSHW